MSIAKPFTFVANTHAKSSEVNANFDTVYSQVNTNISAIAQNATDIDNLENNKADINGSSSQRFAVADAITEADAVNKRSLRNAIGNSIDYISGFTITKDSGSPNDTIIVSAGSAYDSTKSVVLSLDNSLSKQNTNQAANATYYVYVIGNATGSSTDILISTSSASPALPTGYSLFRQIGNYTTNSDNSIDVINYYGHNSTNPQGIATVVKSYVNGTSWYRVWSDRFVEQGGNAGLNGIAVTVNLLIPYKDTNYNITIGLNSNYTNWIQAQGGGWYNKTTTTFDLLPAQYAGNRDWCARGYIS
jgi:hypothetical protein